MNVAKLIWIIVLLLPIGAFVTRRRSPMISRTYVAGCCVLGGWGVLKLIGVPAWVDWPVWGIGVALLFADAGRNLVQIRRHKRAWRAGRPERIEAYLELLSKLEIAAYLQPAVRADPRWQESRKLCREMLSMHEVNLETITFELDETALTGVTMRPPSPN